MSFFTRLRRWIQRLTPLEAAVLNGVTAALPAAEGEVFQVQLRAAWFDRQIGCRTITFHFPQRKSVPQLEWLAGRRREVLAVVKAKGEASRFTTTAKVITVDGLLAELCFDIIPWSGGESFDIECQILDTPLL